MDYFREMKEVSDKVDIAIGKLISEEGYKDFNLRDIFEKRKGHPKMRPYLTQLSFELCKGSGDISEVNALSEINNLHLYLDNWIFDNKNNVWDSKNIQQVISEININNQVYEELTDVLISRLNLTPKKELAIRKEFDKQVIACYKGQKIDLRTNMRMINDFKTDEEFISFYSKKCELLSGDAYGLSAWLGAFMANSSEKQIKRLYDFGKMLGTGLHMSNDLGDFALLNTKSTLKSYQDQMSDLINSRLTLPIYYVLRYGSPEQKKVFLSIEKKKRSSSQREKTMASRIVMESGAYKFSFKIIKQYWIKSKKFLHTNFPKSITRDKLSYLTSIIKSNKYLYALRSKKGIERNI